ncbi:DUF6301 family protein [Nocardia tengchongensis]|uniref:DUF6301 family protein n=1 Tax=Nocardia tengchongensis TaxID=2055889 RepID=UPI0036B0DCC5
MQADIDGAVQIARLAAGFDWSWTTSNLEDFCSAAGWREEKPSQHGASYHTGLDLQRNNARVRFDRGFLATLGASAQQEVPEAWVLVTDRVDPDDPYSEESLVDLFAQLSGRISEELGPASRRDFGSRPGLVWDLPKLVLVLEMNNRLSLTMSNPLYRRWHDQSVRVEEGIMPSDEDDQTNLTRPSTWSEFSRASALTAALLPEDGRLSIAASPGWSITFVMDELQLKCIIRLKSDGVAAVRVPAEQRIRLVEQGWVEGTDRFGDHWDRSVEWPVRLRDARELTDAAVESLQTMIGVACPSDLRIDAWAIRGEIVPDISRLGPSSAARPPAHRLQSWLPARFRRHL